MQRDRILRPAEVAQATGLTRSTLSRYRRLGYGPRFLKVGQRAVGYFESDLVLWLERRRKQQ